MRRLICSAFLFLATPSFSADAVDGCRQLSGFMQATGVARDMGTPLYDAMEMIPRGRNVREKEVEGMLLEMMVFAYSDGRRLSPDDLAARAFRVCMDILGRES
jgi:hypothetical protein